jgi:hypothetical protein
MEIAAAIPTLPQPRRRRDISLKPGVYEGRILRARSVNGTSPSTIAYHEKQKKEGKVASKTAPKKDHHKKVVVPTITTPGEIAIVKKPEIPVIPPVLVGYAMGMLKSLAAQIARENQLPEEAFTRIAAANLAELTKQ